MDLKNFVAQLKNFFRENLSEIIGAYFDGQKIFIARLTENFETVEVDAGGSEIEHLAEKISIVCAQKGWKTSAVGFCLREEDVVIYQSNIGNVPEKEIPAQVKTWAIAHSGKDALFSFAKVDEELWMETLSRAKADEFDAAFKKFNLNLRGLSSMPTTLLEKNNPYDKTKFIAEIVRDKKNPNIFSARDSVWNWKKFSAAVAAIFFIVMIIGSAKILFDYHEASNKLDAAKISIDELREDLNLKKNLDVDIDMLHKINQLAAKIEPEQNLNFLINLGKISGGDVRLTEIQIEENFLELEGIAQNPDAVKNYLARVKNSVAQNARLENSSENDDGEFVFMIRATLK